VPPNASDSETRTASSAAPNPHPARHVYSSHNRNKNQPDHERICPGSACMGNPHPFAVCVTWAGAFARLAARRKDGVLVHESRGCGRDTSLRTGRGWIDWCGRTMWAMPTLSNDMAIDMRVYVRQQAELMEEP
jgi:hypothetical protein